MKWEFKENHTFGELANRFAVILKCVLVPPWQRVYTVLCVHVDERQSEAKKIREKYPDRIPVCSTIYGVKDIVKDYY